MIACRPRRTGLGSERGRRTVRVLAINRIADLNALELIAVLDARRNSAAIRAARRIEREARKAPHEPRSDVELDRHALGELIEVLSEARWEGDFSRRGASAGSGEQGFRARRMGTRGPLVPKPPENDRKLR